MANFGSCVSAATVVVSTMLAAATAVGAFDSGPARGTVSARASSDQGAPADGADTATPALPIPAYQTPRQLLELLGIDTSQLDELERPSMATSEHSTLVMRLLDRMDSIDANDIGRWQHTDVSWHHAVQHADEYRGEFIWIAGRVRQFHRRSLPAELESLFAWDHYYEIVLAPSDQPARRVTVVTRRVPAAWSTDDPAGQFAGVAGMFLTKTTTGPQPGGALFAARRIGWFPDHVTPELGVTPSHVALAAHGFDIGLLDRLRPRNGLPIANSEWECLYQLISAARGMTRADLDRVTRPMDIVAVLQDPESLPGDFLDVDCQIRRIRTVEITDLSIHSRLQLRRYYQIDALIGLGSQAIELRAGKAAGTSPVYTNSFPVVFFCADLPDRWQAFVDQPQMNERAHVVGCFCRLCSYPSNFVAHFTDARQLCPLLVATQIRSVEPPAAASNRGGVLVGSLVLVGLAMLWIAIIRSHRSDSRRRRIAAKPLDFGPFDDADGHESG